MYTRFKDDVQIAMESLLKGSRFKEGKIVVDENEKILDENITDTKVTMTIIHLNIFMLKLKRSGYNQKTCTETLDSCLNAHEK